MLLYDRGIAEAIQFGYVRIAINGIIGSSLQYTEYLIYYKLSLNRVKY